jgi:hypothetical protein
LGKFLASKEEGKLKKKEPEKREEEKIEEKIKETSNQVPEITINNEDKEEPPIKPPIVAASPKLSYSRAKLLSNQDTDSPSNSPKLNTRKNDEINSSTGKLNGSPSTKHRPLSAASISSASSSSSSTGSTSSNSYSTEHLTSKVTYLASIESLADDHSENESLEIHSLTMCERAALEIIESEKNFVDDLGEIIRG